MASAASFRACPLCDRTQLTSMSRSMRRAADLGGQAAHACLGGDSCAVGEGDGCLAIGEHHKLVPAGVLGDRGVDGLQLSPRNVTRFRAAGPARWCRRWRQRQIPAPAFPGTIEASVAITAGARRPAGGGTAVRRRRWSWTVTLFARTADREATVDRRASAVAVS